MALLGPRAAVLQNMLPALGQGVEDHSVWFAETLARLQRSIPPIFNTVYGADPETSGHEVRDFHRPIKGRLPDGSPYSALNPDTYYWAHACFVEHLITATDTFIRRLSRAEKEQIFARVDHLVRAVRRELARHAADLRGVRDYFEHALEERLVAHRTASYGVGYATKGWPRPKRIPTPVWWLVKRPVNAVSSSLTIGGMPPRGTRDPRPAVGRRRASGATSGSPRSAALWTASTGGCPAATGCTRSRCARSSARVAGPRLGPWLTAHPLGLLDTDSLINEEDRAIQQTVRRFVDDRIRPDIAEWYENGTRPCARSPASSARSARSGCTSRATAAPARARRPTGWPASRSRPATPGSGR